MTPEERANKFSERDFRTMYYWRLKELIATVIREAVQEAKEETILRLGQWEHAAHVAHNCRGCRDKAYEECARIAEKFKKDLDQGCPYEIAEAIRAKAKEI